MYFKIAKRENYLFAKLLMMIFFLSLLPEISFSQVLQSVRVPNELQEGNKILNQKNLDLKELQESFDTNLYQIKEEIEIIDSCLSVEKDPGKKEVFHIAKEFKRSEALSVVSDYLNQILEIRNDMERALSLIAEGVKKSADTYSPKQYVDYINKLQTKHYKITNKLYNASLIKSNIHDPVLSGALDGLIIGFSKLRGEYSKQEKTFLGLTKQIQSGVAGLEIIKDQVQLAKAMFANTSEYIEGQRDYLQEFARAKAIDVYDDSIRDQLRKFFTKLRQIKIEGIPDISGTLNQIYDGYDFDLGWDEYDEQAYDLELTENFGREQHSIDELINSVLEEGKPVKPARLEALDVLGY